MPITACGKDELTTEDILEIKIAIRKYNLIAMGCLEIVENLGAGNCGLCTMYWTEFCKGCPISERTGYAGCAGTPYSKINGTAFVISERIANRKIVGVKNKRRLDIGLYALEDEIDFLVALLPIEECRAERYVI